MWVVDLRRERWGAVVHWRCGESKAWRSWKFFEKLHYKFGASYQLVSQGSGLECAYEVLTCLKRIVRVELYFYSII